jgi:hypothetical protein
MIRLISTVLVGIGTMVLWRMRKSDIAEYGRGEAGDSVEAA